MNGLDQFRKFAKQTKTKKITSNKAVIYTRVSGSKQEDNTSLESQSILCTQYASRLELNVMKYFGGTSESAKTDERKEFKKMITYVKKNKIAFIIVYSIDRFSRAGASAITIVEELKKIGINVLSVTQPVDVNTATGMFFQNLNLLFSKYDNDQRRDKTITGMHQRLLNGYWMGKAPLGYKNARDENNAPTIVFDEKAPLIKKAFEWKLYNKLSNQQILDRLELRGLKMYKQKLSQIFKNPAYCGIIAHNLLEGEIVKGKYKPLITKKMFLEINGLSNRGNYKQTKVNENLPLKGGFIKCEKCKNPLTGYIVKSKNIHYYKCNTKGCKCNKNATKLNSKFLELLKKYKVEKNDLAILETQLKNTFEYFSNSNKDNTANLKHRLKEISKKIETIEERYAIGEINTDIFTKYSEKYKIEKEEIQKEISKTSFEKSNLDIFIKSSLELCHNLPKMWNLSSYAEKQKLQNLLFPKGIMYNRENDSYRTIEVNSILELTYSFSVILNQKKNGQKNKNVNLSSLVAGTGLEPVTFGL